MSLHRTNTKTITPKPTNYLQNRTLLEQIHLSKNSYCWFEQPQHHRYDLIIDLPLVDEALALISTASAQETARAEFRKREGREPLLEELVFRVMTTVHIPPAALEGMASRVKNKKLRKQEADYNEDDEDENVDAGVPFPPFKHYRFNNNGSLVVCGISHWHRGEFSTTHGAVTKELALAWLQLCQRYSTKYNFRGYSYIDEMRAAALIQLVQVGLKFNEARSDNPFAYLTAVVNNAFIRQLKKEKVEGDIKNELREYAGLDGSFSRQAGVDND
jgi:hypothetical protein